MDCIRYEENVRKLHDIMWIESSDLTKASISVFLTFALHFLIAHFAFSLLSYTKPRGRVPDYSAPVVVPAGKCTVAEFCNRIHRGLLEQFKEALVWGSSVRHAPQHVGKDHVLADEDVVQIVKRVK